MAGRRGGRCPPENRQLAKCWLNAPGVCRRHSLGGALASLCAYDIKKRCPCAGARSAVRAVQGALCRNGGNGLDASAHLGGCRACASELSTTGKLFRQTDALHLCSSNEPNSNESNHACLVR